jgi:hypothetical protein
MSSYQINATIELLKFLSQSDDNKYSKMEALVDLLNKATHNLQLSETSKITLQAVLPVCITDLAKEWNWHRGTVRNFLLGLSKFGVITLDTSGKTFRIIVHFRESEDMSEQCQLANENLKLAQWICGFIDLQEELFDSMNFINETEQFFTIAPTNNNGNALGIGQRLHLLIGHILLHRTNIFPYDEKIISALQELFVQHCGHDLGVLLQLLTSAGIALITGQPINVSVTHLAEPEKASVCLEKVMRYYGKCVAPQALA